MQDRYFCGSLGHDWETVNSGETDAEGALASCLRYLEDSGYDTAPVDSTPAKDFLREYAEKVAAGTVPPPKYVQFLQFNEECYQAYYSWGEDAQPFAFSDLRGDNHCTLEIDGFELLTLRN